MPCYNQGIYLPETLNSVLLQTYADWECIIVNDGSTDKTENVALEWKKRDNRFQYIKKENEGLSSARNKGLNVIKGEYVQFLDADDLIDKNKIKYSLEAIGENSPTLVISDFNVLDEATNKLRTSWWSDLKNVDFYFQNILLEWDVSFTIPIHCGFFPAYYFNNIRFDETLGAKEDWLMWLKIFKIYQPNVLYINNPLATYRWSSFGMTKKYSFMHENIHKAFNKVFTEFVTDQDMAAYFSKINNHWFRELQYSEIRNQKILQSRAYKFAANISRSFRCVREGINRWKILN